MSNADEKRVSRIAERNGFRLEKAGHGKGHGRFYIVNPVEGAGCVPASPTTSIPFR